MKSLFLIMAFLEAISVGARFIPLDEVVLALLQLAAAGRALTWIAMFLWNNGEPAGEEP